MTHRSFDLHAILGEELKPYGSTDHRRLTCAAVAAVEGSLVAKPSNKKLENVEWADAGGVVGMRPMGDESTIAQVHPRKLCDALVAGAKALAGASVVEGCAAGLRENADGVVDGLLLADGSCLDADAVVVCMGPWSHALGRPKTEKMGLIGDEGYSGWGLAGLPPVVGTKYHAVLLQAPRVLSQAVFFQGYGDPEVYPRPDGETYVTGSPDAADIVRDLPGETPVREEVCTKLINSMNALSTELKDAPVNHKQACHLPSAIDGVPVVGEIKPGAYPFQRLRLIRSAPRRGEMSRRRRGCKLDLLRTGRVAAGAKRGSRRYAGFGHGCWGILLGPATGEALANLICTDSSPTLVLRRFDPKRFAGKFAA